MSRNQKNMLMKEKITQNQSNGMKGIERMEKQSENESDKYCGQVKGMAISNKREGKRQTDEWNQQMTTIARVD